MLSWTVEITEAADREIRDLPPDLQGRFFHISEMLEELGPQRVGMPARPFHRTRTMGNEDERSRWDRESNLFPGRQRPAFDRGSGLCEEVEEDGAARD